MMKKNSKVAVKKSLGLRLWHYLNALVILGLLATVLLRKTFLSWRGNKALIETKLQESGVSISPELAREIAVQIRAPMWDWHYVLGFSLAGLLLLRLGVWIFSKKTEKFKSLSLHHKMVKVTYYVFYIVTLFMVITGVSMYFKAELGFSKDFADSIKEIHELTMWFFVAFVVAHILGVIVAENRDEPGIVSDMINGGKK